MLRVLYSLEKEPVNKSTEREVKSKKGLSMRVLMIQMSYLTNW